MTPLEYFLSAFPRLSRHCDLTPEIAEDALRSGDLNCVVFLEESTPVGFALYTKREEALWVSGLVVEPGRLDSAIHIGSELARKLGCRSLRFMSRRARAWLRRLPRAVSGDGYIELEVAHG